jgi:hypothetical protein
VTAVVVGGGALAPFVPLRALLFAIIGLLLVAPVAVRLARGKFDLLEPIVLANVALGIMFFLRPLALVSAGQEEWRSIDIADAFDSTLLLCAAGIAAFQLGYLVPLGRAIGRRVPGLPANVDPGTTTAIAIALGGAGLLGVLVFTPAAGGITGGFFPGSREQSAYAYQLPYLLSPAALLLLRVGAQRRDRVVSTAALAVLGMVVLFTAPAGNRVVVLTVIGGVMAFPMLRSGWRPRPWLVLVLLFPVFIVLASLRDLGPESGASGFGSAIQHHAVHPREAWNEAVLGFDTEMFDGLAGLTMAVDGDLGRHPGHSLKVLLTHPIPRSLWPGKPRQGEDFVNDYYFADTYFVIGDAGTAYSALGGFYYDSGMAGVVIGMFLLGLALRALWGYYQRHAGNESVALVYAASLPLVLRVMREQPQGALALGLFIVVPLVLATWIAARTVVPRPTMGSPGVPRRTSTA